MLPRHEFSDDRAVHIVHSKQFILAPKGPERFQM